jgi:hypothetical protein
MASEHSGQLSPPSLTLTRQRLEAAGPRQLEDLRHRFATEHLVRLPGFLDDNLLTEFERRVAGAPFTPRIEDGVEIEETLADAVVEALLIFPLNDPALFAAIDAITECGSVGCFTGRIFRRRADAAGQYYPWHTDVAHDRLVGLTINLGRDRFNGGVLQLRQVGSAQPFGEVHNTVRGDAVLFRIREDVEHHVTPVTGATPRLTLAGWFRRRPEFWRSLSHKNPRAATAD